MTYEITVRYQSGKTTQRGKMGSWGDINDYIRGLGKPGSFPRGTVLTVRSEASGIEERFSVRGGGTESIKLVKLTDRITGILPGGKPEPSIGPLAG